MSLLLLIRTKLWRIASTRGERFDCVVIDYLMPVKNGVQLAIELKQNDPNITLILSSGFAEEAVFDSSLFDGFLAKPYFPNQLIEIVSNATRRRLPG